MAFCSISGSVPEVPVVSIKSGHVFEKNLVAKYVKETGKCPVTGEALGLEDLIDLKASKTVKPRPNPATSIPGLLGLFHDEWDALMLETHSLRGSLHTVRQELSHALYMHDAATRVIARLVKERDEARAALSNVKASMEAGDAAMAAKRAADAMASAGDAADAPGAAEGEGKRQKKATMPEAVIEELTSVNAQLSKARKKRAISTTLATVDELEGMSVIASHPLHKTTAGGIVSIDVNPGAPSVLATAGLDHTIQIFDHVPGRLLGSLTGHGKRLTQVAYASPNVLLSTSADKTARIWSGEGGTYSCAAILKEHAAEVVGVTVHPSGKYFVTGGADATWCFYDVEQAECLRQVVADDPSDKYTAVQFHPDGLILGAATETSLIRIWEVKQQKCVATFEGHVKPVRGLAFSENGFHLASVSDDCVKLWDLRKLKNFKTLEPYAGSAPCAAVTWDHSGNYLAVGGADARVYSTKSDFGVVKTFSDMPKKGVMSLKFGPDAKSLYVGSADHNLRVVGMEPAAMQE
ncbi:hypothetical protein FOA52_006288 [Chlamydomonas sp. UWO 241]|nr:hypothetical protein FOA52_006288 [Chlamydomonas sp. UWO 241]